MPERLSRRNLWYAAVLLAAAIIGGVIGGWIHFVGSAPSMASLLAVLILIPFGITVGLVFVIGLVMLPSRARSGTQMLGVAMALAVGAYVGGLIGPDWRGPIETPAQVSVTLDAPISQSFSGPGGTCRTVENGDQITHVSSGPIIEAGTDRMIISINLPRDESNGGARIYGFRTEGRLADYSGLFNAPIEFETDGLRMTGSGAFAELNASERGERLGGVSGPMTLSGSFTWTCSPLGDGR